MLSLRRTVELPTFRVPTARPHLPPECSIAHRVGWHCRAAVPSSAFHPLAPSSASSPSLRISMAFQAKTKQPEALCRSLKLPDQIRPQRVGLRWAVPIDNGGPHRCSAAPCSRGSGYSIREALDKRPSPRNSPCAISSKTASSASSPPAGRRSRHSPEPSGWPRTWA